MDTKEFLGRRVRDLRKKRGLTQERLAEMAGVDVKYLTVRLNPNRRWDAFQLL
ncbi:MAG: helix-turn-helix transcriptional regulator [Thermoplasmata archaeon]